MNYLPSNRKQAKFLKQLLNTKSTYKRGFVVNSDFYSMFKYEEIEIIQMLNALSSKELIKLTPPNAQCKYPHITITPKAFSYIPDLQDNLFRFWIPIIVSSCLSVAAITISLISLLSK